MIPIPDQKKVFQYYKVLVVPVIVLAASVNSILLFFCFVFGLFVCLFFVFCFYFVVFFFFFCFFFFFLFFLLRPRCFWLTVSLILCRS